MNPSRKLPQVFVFMIHQVRIHLVVRIHFGEWVAVCRPRRGVKILKCTIDKLLYDSAEALTNLPVNFYVLVRRDPSFSTGRRCPVFLRKVNDGDIHLKA